ncbi:MAG: hypothetical protein AAGM22_10315 [Acidobacteriota bacterium]
MFDAALLRSVDQGASWEVVIDNLTGLFSGRWRFLKTTAPVAPGPLFASLLDPFGGTLYRSDDGGDTWRPSDQPAGSVQVILENPTANRLLAGTLETGVLESVDGGATFAPLDRGLLSARVNALAFDPTDPGRLWAATDGGAHRFGDAAATGRCRPSERVLCLLDRFQVEVDWTDFAGVTGTGSPFPMTANTGGFSFFSPGNLEFAMKVLDGRAFNGHFWLFYGGLSTVTYELTVTDLETGVVRRVENESGGLTGGADILAFPAAGSGGEGSPSGESTAGAESSLSTVDGPLRLLDGRFELEVRFRTDTGLAGVAAATALSRETGAFSFFDADNLEVFVKVLDGRGFNGHFWLFFTGLSNVAYDVVITDTETGEERVYSNPQGEFGGLADTQLF